MRTGESHRPRQGRRGSFTGKDFVVVADEVVDDVCPGPLLDCGPVGAALYSACLTGSAASSAIAAVKDDPPPGVPNKPVRPGSTRSRGSPAAGAMTGRPLAMASCTVWQAEWVRSSVDEYAQENRVQPGQLGAVARAEEDRVWHRPSHPPCRGRTVADDDHLDAGSSEARRAGRPASRRRAGRRSRRWLRSGPRPTDRLDRAAPGRTGRGVDDAPPPQPYPRHPVGDQIPGGRGGRGEGAAARSWMRVDPAPGGRFAEAEAVRPGVRGCRSGTGDDRHVEADGRLDSPRAEDERAGQCTTSGRAAASASAMCRPGRARRTPEMGRGDRRYPDHVGRHGSATRRVVTLTRCDHHDRVRARRDAEGLRRRCWTPRSHRAERIRGQWPRA